MGGTSKSEQKQTSQATPYDQARPGLDGALSGMTGLLSSAGLNSAQSGAINQLTQNGQAGNPYTGAIGSSAQGLLNGGGANDNNSAISQNLTNYRGMLSPIANGSMVGKNPALQSQLNGIQNDVTNGVNSQFAAAGRDGSPANQMALGRGIAQAEAPVLASQYNQDIGNQMNAANALYGAGNNTYGMLNHNQQAANQNQLAGSGQASTALQAQNYGPNAVLNAQQQAFNIPAQNYQTLLGSISPIAQAFGTNTGTSNGSQTMSG